MKIVEENKASFSRSSGIATTLPERDDSEFSGGLRECVSEFNNSYIKSSFHENFLFYRYFICSNPEFTLILKKDHIKVENSPLVVKTTGRSTYGVEKNVYTMLENRAPIKEYPSLKSAILIYGSSNLICAFILFLLNCFVGKKLYKKNILTAVEITRNVIKALLFFIIVTIVGYVHLLSIAKNMWILLGV